MLSAVENTGQSASDFPQERVDSDRTALEEALQQSQAISVCMIADGVTTRSSGKHTFQRTKPTNKGTTRQRKHRTYKHTSLAHPWNAVKKDDFRFRREEYPGPSRNLEHLAIASSSIIEQDWVFRFADVFCLWSSSSSDLPRPSCMNRRNNHAKGLRLTGSSNRPLCVSLRGIRTAHLFFGTQCTQKRFRHYGCGSVVLSPSWV